jgi:hypothetical protein
LEQNKNNFSGATSPGVGTPDMMPNLRAAMRKLQTFTDAH